MADELIKFIAAIHFHHDLILISRKLLRYSSIILCMAFHSALYNRRIKTKKGVDYEKNIYSKI